MYWAAPYLLISSEQIPYVQVHLHILLYLPQAINYRFRAYFVYTRSFLPFLFRYAETFAFKA